MILCKIEKFETLDLIRTSIKEDLGGYGDITSRFLIPDNLESKAFIVCKEPAGGVLSGIDIVDYVFKEIDPEIKLETLKKDGQALKIKDIICKITGPAQSLLAGERTALNFLQHMSGIATYTAKFVSIASRYKARVADTRKTKPGLRKLEKYAVLCGGGFNHRFGLFDGVLIKDNHIVAAGSIGNAIEQIRQKIPHNQKIEVEVKNERETLEAIKHNADIIMLDNMDTKEIKKSVELIRSKTSGSCLIEVSGGVNLESLEDICKTGVDIVSAGCITHSAPAVDFSMEFA